MTGRLTRLPAQGKIAGVCAGIANYLDTDITIVRLVWVVLSIVPGALIGGLVAYVAAWFLMPIGEAAPASLNRRRVYRSLSDKKIGGVCSGLGHYFNIDPVAMRVLWVVLSIYPGAVICGVIAYAIAWFIIPAEPHLPMEPAPLPL